MAGFFYIFFYAPTRIAPGLVVHPYYSPGPEASWQSGTLPHAEACPRPYTKGINTQPHMTNTEIVANIYTCLEMLRLDSEELHAWWCNLLYCVDGEPNYRAWDEFNLSILENDLIYNV